MISEILLVVALVLTYAVGIFFGYVWGRLDQINATLKRTLNELRRLGSNQNDRPR